VRRSDGFSRAIFPMRSPPTTCCDGSSEPGGQRDGQALPAAANCAVTVHNRARPLAMAIGLSW